MDGNMQKFVNDEHGSLVPNAVLVLKNQTVASCLRLFHWSRIFQSAPHWTLVGLVTLAVDLNERPIVTINQIFGICIQFQSQVKGHDHWDFIIIVTMVIIHDGVCTVWKWRRNPSIHLSLAWCRSWIPIISLSHMDGGEKVLEWLNLVVVVCSM